MSEHKVTENIIQSGNTRTIQFSCSCGASTDIIDLTKTTLSTARKVFAELIHDPKTEKVKTKKEKKSKKQKLTAKDSEAPWNEHGDDEFAQPSKED